MKANELKKLHDITSCAYAEKTLDEHGFEIDDDYNLTMMVANAYEDGYKQCFADLSCAKFNFPDKAKMTKEECNEQIAIAFNALAQIVINYYTDMQFHSKALEMMSELTKFYLAPL